MIYQHYPVTKDTQKRTMSLTSRVRIARRQKKAGGVLVAAAFLLIGCYRLVWYDSSLVPEAVDLARAVFGPAAVGQVEGWALQTQDTMRQVQYQATGAKSTVQWAAPATTIQSIHPTPLAQPRATAVVPQSVGANQAVPSASDQISEQVNWSPFVTSASGQPILERALVPPDPSRPYVQAALVRIDLSAAQLHLVAGTDEPHSPVRVARSGTIPVRDRRSGIVLAAFNGGFKAVNGAFGMMVQGTTLLPPKPGLATLALMRDGSLRLGVWGNDITTTPDLIAYRQNCPLLVDKGTLTPQAANDDATLWGHTVGNKVATWRSGLGLSADSRYLIYVAGDGLTVPTLARALIQAGANRAMQLDINSFWTRFVTFAHTSNDHLEAQKLTDSMQGDTRQFLAPDSRDFFYVTAK